MSDYVVRQGIGYFAETIRYDESQSGAPAVSACLSGNRAPGAYSTQTTIKYPGASYDLPIADVDRRTTAKVASMRDPVSHDVVYRPVPAGDRGGAAFDRPEETR
jgi:hypothetical protein